jgi:DNA (cytosine-5)-methyltransferase 1
VRPKAIDLFCGAGGMSLGFEQAGFDIVLGVDRDPYHCAAHERNFPYGQTLCASVDTLTGDSIRRLFNLDEDIALVFGGPPCQGFSTMGKRDSGDPRNSLVGEFVRIVKEIRPKAFVMENVPGMQLGKTRAFFEFVVETLADAGYRITLPAKTLWATDFGAPQKRQRLFVLGAREDQPRTIAYPTHADAVQPIARNVGQAFQGLPVVEGVERLYSEDTIKFKPAKRHVTAAYARVLAGIDDDPTDFSYRRKSTSGLLFGNKLTRHSAASTDLYRATVPGTMVPGHKLPRLHLEGIAPTLRAGSESERGSHTPPRPIHPQFPRCITVREAARR